MGSLLQNRRLRVQVLVPLPRSPNRFCSVIFFFTLLLIAFTVPEVRVSPIRFFTVLCFPLFFPLLGRICFPYGFIESLHSCGTVPLHFFCYMTVNVQRKSCRGMAWVGLYSFDVIPFLTLQLFQFFFTHRQAPFAIMDKTKATSFLQLIAFGLVIM